MSSINANAVDWVLIEVKNSAGLSVQKKAALLLKDGTVVDATTGSFLTLNSTVSDAYYKIIIRHRNHLAIATDSNIYLSQYTSVNVDLSKNVNVKAANQNLLGTVSGVNVYGMRFGDVNSDGYIDASDKNIVINSNEAVNSYSKIDVNIDSQIEPTDRNMMSTAGEAVENL